MVVVVVVCCVVCGGDSKSKQPASNVVARINTTSFSIMIVSPIRAGLVSEQISGGTKKARQARSTPFAAPRRADRHRSRGTPYFR